LLLIYESKRNLIIDFIIPLLNYKSNINLLFIRFNTSDKSAPPKWVEVSKTKQSSTIIITVLRSQR